MKELWKIVLTIIAGIAIGCVVGVVVVILLNFLEFTPLFILLPCAFVLIMLGLYLPVLLTLFASIFIFSKRSRDELILCLKGSPVTFDDTPLPVHQALFAHLAAFASFWCEVEIWINIGF